MVWTFLLCPGFGRHGMFDRLSIVLTIKLLIVGTVHCTLEFLCPMPRVTLNLMTNAKNTFCCRTLQSHVVRQRYKRQKIFGLPFFREIISDPLYRTESARLLMCFSILLGALRSYHKCQINTSRTSHVGSQFPIRQELSIQHHPLPIIKRHDHVGLLSSRSNRLRRSHERRWDALHHWICSYHLHGVECETEARW